MEVSLRLTISTIVVAIVSGLPTVNEVKTYTFSDDTLLVILPSGGKGLGNGRTVDFASGATEIFHT